MDAAYANGKNPADPVQQARERMMNKAERERQEREEQAQEHQLNEQIRAEAKTHELETLLAKAPKDGAFWIRLAAAEHMLSRGAQVYGNLRQMQYDECALEMARYAVLGQV